jgi:hypothetical protein
MELKDLGITLQENARDTSDQIIRRWREIADAEPWLALPPNLSFDHLPQLIRGMANAALCSDFSREACAEVAATAADHGHYRAGEGFDENLIYREYHLLRRAFADRLQEDHGRGAFVFMATMRLDSIGSLCQAAALHGLHRGPSIQDGRDSEVLRDLLDRWPLPES